MKITIRVTEDATNRYGTITGERVIIDCSEQVFTPTLTANFLRALADEIAPRRRDVEGEPVLADWERELLYGQKP